MIQKTHKEPKIALCRACRGTGNVIARNGKVICKCQQCGGSGRVLVSGDITLDIRPYQPEDVEPK